MPTPVRSTDFHRAAKKALDPWARVAGFTARRGRSSTWEKRLAPDLGLTLWLQVDKYGWFDDHGSRFTVNFELDGEASKRAEPGRRSARFGELLDPSDEDAFAAIAEGVCAKLPAKAADADEDDDEPGSWVATTLEMSDPWMSYYEVEDVVRWCEGFLVPRFDRMIEALLQGGRDRLPAGLETLAMPGLDVRREDALTVVRVPRAGAPVLRAWIERATPGDSVLLRAEGLAVVLDAAPTRRGSMSAVRRVGLTEVRRVDWRIGTGAMGCVAGMLAGEVGEVVEVKETLGEVVKGTGIGIAVV